MNSVFSEFIVNFLAANSSRKVDIDTQNEPCKFLVSLLFFADFSDNFFFSR